MLAFLYLNGYSIMHISEDDLYELSKYTHETGRQLDNSSGLARLKDIEKYLPVLEEFDYVDDVFSFKTLGNIEPHTDIDSYDSTLFILTDKIYPSCVSEAHCVFLLTDGWINLSVGSCVLFDHKEYHAIMCNHGWAGLAIPLMKKEVR